VFGFSKRGKVSTNSSDFTGVINEVRGALSGHQGGKAVGLVSGTRVATSKGWCPVEKVAIGDSVLTFDAGLQVVIAASHNLIWDRDEPCPKALWPLLVPSGSIGNIDETLLLPDQAVMVKTPRSVAQQGMSTALISASALVGWRGIRRVIPSIPVEGFTIYFASNQVVLANIGLQFLCSAQRSQALSNGSLRNAVAYDVLTPEKARVLVKNLEFEDQQTGATTKPITPKDRIYAAFAV